MEPKFQTSFIPKAPITGGATVNRAVPRETTVSFLPTLGSIVFALSLIAAGALFGYEQFLNSQITDLNKSLSLAQAAFDQSTIHELTTASDQIRAARTLLNAHIAVSNLFAVLESNVLPSVQFNNFAFQRGTDGLVNVTVDGFAQSYASAAQQADLFNNLSYMKKTAFSTLDLTDKGTISMRFTSTIDQSVLSYKEALQNVPGNTEETMTSSTPPTN